MSKDSGIAVYSDKRHKPQYYVTLNDKVVFESDSGSEALQWAIDHVVEQTIFLSVVPSISIKYKNKKNKE